MQAFIDLPKSLNTLTGLQLFYDEVERHVRSLSTLGESVDSYGDLLVPVILNKLPLPTRKNMVREHTSNEWNITELQEAIKKDVKVFKSELLAGHLPQGTHATATFHAGTSKPTNRHSGQSTMPAQCSCAFCKGPHSPVDCQIMASSQARKDFVTDRHLCFNYLGKHRVSTCSS